MQTGPHDTSEEVGAIAAPILLSCEMLADHASKELGGASGPNVLEDQQPRGLFLLGRIPEGTVG